MKKVICKVEYDTEASELIQKKVFGVFGDPKGYDRRLPGGFLLPVFLAKVVPERV